MFPGARFSDVTWEHIFRFSKYKKSDQPGNIFSDLKKSDQPGNVFYILKLSAYKKSLHNQHDNFIPFYGINESVNHIIKF